MSGWCIPRYVWGYGLTVWMVQRQVGLTHPSSADQGSPVDGIQAATQLSKDLRPCCSGRSTPSRRQQAGRQRWIASHCKHPLSMSPKQNPFTILFRLFSLGCHSCSTGSLNGATREIYPQIKSGSVHWVNSPTDLPHSGSDIKRTGQYSRNYTLGLVVSAWIKTLIQQSLIQGEASEWCLGMS